MLMNYHIGRLVLSSLCVGAFVAAGIWWCSCCRLKPATRTPPNTSIISYGLRLTQLNQGTAGTKHVKEDYPSVIWFPHAVCVLERN